MSLEQMRKLLIAKDPELASQAKKPRADTSIYPHWEMATNATATLRFLPDGNTDNTFIWVERDVIKLYFQGIKGKPEVGHVQVQVPCMEMYEEECTVLQVVRSWMKDPSLEDMARRYWKKRSYFYQGFVRESPFRESDAPTNPIRQFNIGPQIQHQQAPRRAFKVLVNVFVFINRVTHLRRTFVDVPQSQQTSSQQKAGNVALCLIALVMQYGQRPWADDAHVAFEYAVKLWQFI